MDCAKVGLGVSKACKTRQYTGFGSTTISDLEKCANAKKNIKIISDGGMSQSPDGEPCIGDIAKAIRFGADYVCSGLLFSQCSDSPSIKHGYYGNSTARAKNHNNNVEGTTVKVYSNDLTIRETIKLTEDSLRSSVSYAGGKCLRDIKSVDYTIV